MIDDPPQNNRNTGVGNREMAVGYRSLEMTSHMQQTKKWLL
jgi:hypothetical protein